MSPPPRSNRYDFSASKNKLRKTWTQPWVTQMAESPSHLLCVSNWSPETTLKRTSLFCECSDPRVFTHLQCSCLLTPVNHTRSHLSLWAMIMRRKRRSGSAGLPDQYFPFHCPRSLMSGGLCKGHSGSASWWDQTWDWRTNGELLWSKPSTIYKDYFLNICRLLEFFFQLILLTFTHYISK